MDKYEFNIKTEQVKKLIRKKEYRAAAKVADTMDFGKVKNNALLITIADVYEVIGEYDKARDILILAYERAQLGRQIAYRLARVSVKRKDLEEALEYYDDFVAVAPKDASKYILQYDISKLKGEPIESQISILEQYVDDDMDDKWTFELAKLYHQAGNSEKCVELCDTLILWFNEGKYVEKAMELKMLHAPLTKSQQEKYDSRWEAKEPEINIDEIKVKEINVDNKYDTYNIQAEIAKSMVELLGKEGDTTADIFKPEPMLNTTRTDLSENESTQDTLAEDTIEQDTQISMFAAEDEMDTASIEENNQETDFEEEKDDQITGQITLDELLNGMYAPADEDGLPLTDIDEVISSITLSEKAAVDAAKATSDDYAELDKVIDEMDSFNNEAILVSTNTTDEENAKDEEIPVEELEDIDENEAIEELVTEEVFTESADEEVTDEEVSIEDAVVEDIVDEEIEDDAISEKAIDDNEASEQAADEEELGEDSSNEESEKEQSLNAKKLIKEFIDHYSGVEGLDKQIIKTFKSMLGNNNAHNDYLYVMGDVKSGKTTLAMEMTKLIGKIRGNETRKIAKVNGTSLTLKNVETFTDKLGDCNVVIEKAASIKEEVFQKLIELLDENDINRIVVFEDEKSVSEKYMDENPSVGEFFENVIRLKHNRIRDWANIAVDYAKAQGYTIDEMGMLALHAKIDQLYTITLVIHKNHVEQLIDNAITKSNKKSIGKLIKGVFKKNNEENVLTESDFIKD